MYKSGTEMDTLDTDPGHIHKQVDFNVSVEDMPVGKKQVRNYSSPNGASNKSWVDV